MTRLLTALFLAVSLALAGMPAAAGGGYHGGGGYYGKHQPGYARPYYRPYYGWRYGYGGPYWGWSYGVHGDGDDLLAAAAIVGGALLLGNLLSQPRDPLPTRTAVPGYGQPARAPVCLEDRVYRYLPDGSLQWGTRRRCY